ncbi:IS110 family transposase [Embleya sp. NPDC020886]|uniref:IS110 family transposase n=1 Tax=Embleya sp. NPDC020886 TaxID=3363980 RepID=UPI0037880FD6
MVAGIWVGVDIGRTHHHCVAIDDRGNTLLTRRVANEEADLRALITDVTVLGVDPLWIVDLPDGPTDLLRTLLHDRGQQLVYLPGRFMHNVAGSYPGEGKSDARDAAILADQARVRRDLRTLSPPNTIAVDLALLTARRTDLVCDRTRVYNRIRSHLSTIAPTLDRALEVRLQGPLTLLGSYPTPTALRRMGQRRLTAWLRRRHIPRAEALAERALTAAHRQHVIVPGEELAAALIIQLAHEALGLHQRVREVEHRITARFHTHPDAALITSMPGIGDVLGAHFVAATGGDLTRFPNAGSLAAYAGLAPVPHDSGRVSGARRRPHNYNRPLQRVFFQSARISIGCCPASKTYYDRKRAEGKRHTQAVLALARRRVDVLWAIFRDRRPYQPR